MLWIKPSASHMLGEHSTTEPPPQPQFPTIFDPSDPAMKQFLLYLDESNALGKKFIIQDIDDTHVFVIAELVNVLQERPSLAWQQNVLEYDCKP
uniref:General transcription and DNA repair factor IIH subunit TFB5 n=1 Tax=Sciurus vulgaris TaxID=55149 RepID=A0A8D2DCJ4_SCIVU